MSIRSNLRGTCLLFLLMPAGLHGGQNRVHGSADSNSLQEKYNAAQELQRKGKLNDAAVQYQAFVADALDELAMGYGAAQYYSQASPLFKEALALEPDSPSLLLDDARAALIAGNLADTKVLAAEFIQRYPGDRQRLAQAHQLLGRTLLKLNETQEARKELEAAVALDATFPNGYDLAVACLDLGDETCAVQLFAEMERSFGDTAELHMAFGRAYGESDFQPRAVTEFKRAIDENPRLPEVHYLLAAVLLATGGDESHAEEAKEELKKELVNSPNDAKTYAALGELGATSHNYAEAETYLKKAVLLGSENPDAYLYLGQIYFATNRQADAEAALRQCIHLTTDVSRNRYQVQKAHFLLGRILMQKGESDAARAEMSLSRELANKTLSQDKSRLAALTDTSGPGDAPSPETGMIPPVIAVTADPATLRRLESMREHIRLPVADSYNNLGAIAATNNDYSSAIKFFERAAEWNPTLEGLDYNWGRAAFAGSQFAEAIMPLSRYVGAHPDDLGGRAVLGISQFMAGNYRGCIETLGTAIGKSGIAPQAEYVYAESLVRTDQVASGIERLRVIEKAHPEIPDVHRALGEALELRGEREASLIELRTAIGLSPSDADSHYDLGEMELEDGDKVAAISELETASRLLPDSVKFHQALADAYTAALRPAEAQKEIEICNLLRARAQNNLPSHQPAASVQ